MLRQEKMSICQICARRWCLIFCGLLSFHTVPPKTYWNRQERYKTHLFEYLTFRRQKLCLKNLAWQIIGGAPRLHSFSTSIRTLFRLKISRQHPSPEKSNYPPQSFRPLKKFKLVFWAIQEAYFVRFLPEKVTFPTHFPSFAGLVSAKISVNIAFYTLFRPPFCPWREI